MAYTEVWYYYRYYVYEMTHQRTCLMEIEAKYRATARIRAGDIEKIDITPYLLGERETHDLHDTLLDTDGYDIKKQRHSLRVRYDGDAGLLTLKGQKRVLGATHYRNEVELPLGDADPLDVDSWNNALTPLVRDIIGDGTLQPLMTIRNRRRTWAITLNGDTVGEVALDRGKINAKGASEKLHEVEVELKGNGNEADLEAIVAKFTHALPLEAEPRSKAQRAWALLESTAPTEEQLKAASERVPMTADASLAEAGRSVLAGLVLKLLEALPIAKEGSDAEGVHKARVATRRMRAVLEELGGVVYAPRRVATLRQGLRGLARTLGAVRDADVFLIALDDYAKGHDEAFQDEMSALYTYVQKQRKKGRAHLLKQLDSPKHARLLEHLVEFVTTADKDVFVADHDEYTIPLSRVRDFAGSILWAKYETVQAYAPILTTADVLTLHQLRIEVKRLRYCVDLFAGTLGKARKELKRPLAKAQAHLGALQDTEVAIDLLEQVSHKHKSKPALVQYHADVLARQQVLHSLSTAEVGPLLSSDYRQMLADAVARL